MNPTPRTPNVRERILIRLGLPLPTFARNNSYELALLLFLYIRLEGTYLYIYREALLLWNIKRNKRENRGKGRNNRQIRIRELDE